MSVTLLGFDFPQNIRCWQILAAAKIAGVTCNFQNLEMGVDNESVEYMTNCHPLGRAPVLQTEDGYIFESNAILRHIARVDKSNSFLYGRTTFEAAQVDMWLDFAATELAPTSSFFVYKSFGSMGTEEENIKKLATVTETFTGLEKWLETRTFLAGERLTIADISIASVCDWILRYGPQEELTKKYKNVFRHYKTVMNQPKFIEVLKANKAPTDLPKPVAGAAAAPKAAETTQDIPKDLPVAAAAPLIANFKKFAGDKSAYFMYVSLEFINDLGNFLAGPEGFCAAEILTLLTDFTKCEKLCDAYIKIAAVKEKKQTQVREELTKLVEDFMDKKVGGVKKLDLNATAKPKVVVDAETAELLAEFTAFVAGKTQTHTTPKMLKAVMDYLPEGFHKADIKSMLTNGDDCDELLETYVRIAVVPGTEKLRARNELVSFVEAFAESKGITHEEMCF